MNFLGPFGEPSRPYKGSGRHRALRAGHKVSSARVPCSEPPPGTATLPASGRSAQLTRGRPLGGLIFPYGNLIFAR